MKTPKEIKRDMAECAKRARTVIEYCCSAGELAEYAEEASYELIGGLSLIKQLEKDNAQKDERIRKLEREKAALIKIVGETRNVCDYCKMHQGGCIRPANEIGRDKNCFVWRGVEEDEA